MRCCTEDYYIIWRNTHNFLFSLFSYHFSLPLIFSQCFCVLSCTIFFRQFSKFHAPFDFFFCCLLHKQRNQHKFIISHSSLCIIYSMNIWYVVPSSHICSHLSLSFRLMFYVVADRQFQQFYRNPNTKFDSRKNWRYEQYISKPRKHVMLEKFFKIYKLLPYYAYFVQFWPHGHIINARQTHDRPNEVTKNNRKNKIKTKQERSTEEEEHI